LGSERPVIVTERNDLFSARGDSGKGLTYTPYAVENKIRVAAHVRERDSMKKTLVVSAVLFFCLPAIMSAARKPSEKTFTGTRDQVWQAVLTAARGNYVITQVDDKDYIVTFNQGGGILHAEIMFNAVVAPEKDGQVTVSLNYQGKGWAVYGGNLAGNFFKRVDDALNSGNAAQRK
jgi:hypothetical protein